MKNKIVQNKVKLGSSFNRQAQNFDQYEVVPTQPGVNDKKRDKEISNFISNWKSQHTDVKTH